METNVTSCIPSNGSSGFRIRRPIITSNGYSSDTDATVKDLLDELNKLLAKRIFKIEPARAAAAKKGGAEAKFQVDPDLQHLLARELTAKHVSDEKDDKWGDGTLAYEFDEAEEDAKKNTLADYIDQSTKISSLKYSFQAALSRNWGTLDANLKTIFEDHDAISNYLVAYAYLIKGLTDAVALTNFIFNNPEGARNVVDYAVVGAVRTIIYNEKLEVNKYNEDDGDFIQHIKLQNLPLSVVSFGLAAHAAIKTEVFDAKTSKIIDGVLKKSSLNGLSAQVKPLLLNSVKQFSKKSKTAIDADTVMMLLPAAVSEVIGSQTADTGEEVDADVADQDFNVDFFEDDTSTLQISKSAVKCAAQLFYDMVVADELNVLGIANYFTHKYLIRGDIEIQNPRLRDDLQLYVFSNRFTDLKTNQKLDRTRPAERLMFYKQVFDYGTAEVPEELIKNPEYTRLWKVLMLEGARYIERAQASFNPDSYVSRQNVMQAVEDLQYNLSTHCTGMANVVAPLIYAESEFVVRRIFMNEEIRRQVVPAGGSWWRVIEVLSAAMNNTRTKATVVYNKAKLGQRIINAIADYNTASFEDDKIFSGFISDVDAYITTQSILQEALTDDLKADQEEGPARTSPPAASSPEPALTGTPARSGASSGADEWDF